MTHRKTRRGMATLETLFVLPLLFMILFGLMEFGAVLGKWQALTNAAREGAREAIVFRQDCVPATVLAEVQTRVNAYLTAGNVNPDSITVSGLCAGTGTDATVNIVYTHPFLVVKGFASTGPSIVLQGNSTMRNE